MNRTATARLLSVQGTQGLVDLDGAQTPVSTLLVPYAVAGDWVLVHAGFAIQQLPQDGEASPLPAIEEFSAEQVSRGQEDEEGTN